MIVLLRLGLHLPSDPTGKTCAEPRRVFLTHCLEEKQPKPGTDFPKGSASEGVAFEVESLTVRFKVV